jgi:nitric oxide dioxygenase
MLDARTIAVIQQTVPVLIEHGEALTRHFYRRMFANSPEVRELFNPAHQHAGSQQRALAGAICAYAQHIENPAVLNEALELIAHKHVSLGIRPEHYPIVGEHLLAAIGELLGDAATDEILDAWGKAYGFLADVLIKREAMIYAEHTQRFGWRGFKPFIVQRKRAESSVITSFHLVPVDGVAPSRFVAGQYVTVRVPGPDGGTTMRNYSLSCPPGCDHYRISVKRQAGASSGDPAGHVSHHLHDRVNEGDVIEIAPPCGNFILHDGPADRPLVLISGGVGITPLLSMLHAAIDTMPGREIWFIHGAIDGRAHAFREEVAALADRHRQLHVHFRYSEPTDEDRRLRRFHSAGVVDVSHVASIVGGPDADFYFCGPRPLMANVHQGLLRWGVDPSRLHYEFFGPAEALASEVEAPVGG